jgi:hypothetical protein
VVPATGEIARVGRTHERDARGLVRGRAFAAEQVEHESAHLGQARTQRRGLDRDHVLLVCEVDPRLDQRQARGDLLAQRVVSRAPRARHQLRRGCQFLARFRRDHRRHTLGLACAQLRVQIRPRAELARVREAHAVGFAQARQHAFDQRRIARQQDLERILARVRARGVIAQRHHGQVQRGCQAEPGIRARQTLGRVQPRINDGPDPRAADADQRAERSPRGRGARDDRVAGDHGSLHRAAQRLGFLA